MGRCFANEHDTPNRYNVDGVVCEFVDTVFRGCGNRLFDCVSNVCAQIVAAKLPPTHEREARNIDECEIVNRYDIAVGAERNFGSTRTLEIVPQCRRIRLEVFGVVAAVVSDVFRLYHLFHSSRLASSVDLQAHSQTAPLVHQHYAVRRVRIPSHRRVFAGYCVPHFHIHRSNAQCGAFSEFGRGVYVDDQYS